MVEPKQVILPSKGAIITNDGTETVAIPSGDDGNILISDAAATNGVRWVDGGGLLVRENERPRRLYLGHLMSYPNKGASTSASLIYYVQVYISADTVIESMETFIDSGATAARNLRMGMYDQSDPTDFEGAPNNRVAQTANVVLALADNGLYKLVPLDGGGTYTIPTSGYYWVALITDNTNVKFAVSDAFVAAFLPHRHESGAGTTLPATAGSITDPGGALPFIAGVRQV
jgi:hypothetical protein